MVDFILVQKGKLCVYQYIIFLYKSEYCTHVHMTSDL